MRIQQFITEHIEKRLDDCKALVVYDPDHLYRDIVHGMAGDPIHVVDGADSTIAGREDALDIWREMGEDETETRLIVYLPIRKPVSEREQQENPYQIFAIGGDAFPSGQGETYDALCRQAAPDLVPRLAFVS